MIPAGYRKRQRAVNRRRTAKCAWGGKGPGVSTRMKPGTRLRNPELLAVVAEGAMVDVQDWITWLITN